MPLQFYSTNGQAERVDLRDAMMNGQAPDRGLYMPERFPRLSEAERMGFQGKPYAEIAFDILRHYTEGVLEEGVLHSLCEDAYNYPVPLDHVSDRVYVMRLDRGPTASFKDFAARMMARLMGCFCREQGRELVILTATSGDTGSAVASAFHNVPGIRVLVLFPINEVSERQRKQMTTLGGNVRTIAFDGKFDDCQAFVKQAFADHDLRRIPLSSANSINIGRLLPQSVYYCYAHSRICATDERMLVTVPSGNFGNMMGCVIAREMGLPLKRICVPVNANDEFPIYLGSEEYKKVEPSREALSNAMNVGHPSNLPRLVAVYGGQMDHTGAIHKKPDYEAMRRDLFSVSVSDEETRLTIRTAWENHRLLLEPHGAVGWRGFMEALDEEPLHHGPAVVVETAHPAKFPGEIEQLLGFSPDLPHSLEGLDGKKEEFDRMPVNYEAFKEYLASNY